MKVIKLHDTWVRVVAQPNGYLWLEPVPTPPPARDPELDAVMATITGNPLF